MDEGQRDSEQQESETTWDTHKLEKHQKTTVTTIKQEDTTEQEVGQLNIPFIVQVNSKALIYSELSC